MRRGRDDDVPDGPKRFHQVIHLWVMAWCGPLPTVGHMTVQADQGEDGEELVMPVSDWTGQLARERVAQLHRQAKRQRLVRLARAERRGGTSGVGRGPDTIRRPCRSLSAHALGQVALQQGGFHANGSRRVRDATYLGMLFSRSANSPRVGSSTSCGQTAAKPSQVLRPSTIASATRNCPATRCCCQGPAPATHQAQAPAPRRRR